MRKVKYPEFFPYKGRPGIYILENLANSKVYIGSTQCLYSRIKEHLRELKASRHPNDHLQKAFNLYGEDNFAFEIDLDYDAIDNKKLRWIEGQVIDDFDACNPDKGYNGVMEDEDGGKTYNHYVRKNKPRRKVIAYDINKGLITEYPSYTECPVKSGTVTSAIKLGTVTKECLWFYEDTISIDGIKDRFVKINTKKPIKNPSRPVIDLETGIYYYSIVELESALNMTGPTFYKFMKTPDFNKRYSVLKEPRNKR